jgi:hypothetical protein
VSNFTIFWVAHHVIGAGWCPLVAMVPATAAVMTALVLLAFCRTRPRRHVVLASPPKDPAGSNPFAAPARRVARLPPLCFYILCYTGNASMLICVSGCSLCHSVVLKTVDLGDLLV